MTIDKFNFAGKKAIVRVDFNVPLGIHEILGFSLGKRQTSIATLYLLGKHIRSKQTRCHGS